MDFLRYEKNFNTFNKNDMEKIFLKKVCIVGIGGLGGYVSEILTRFGILNLTLVDGDVFSTTNLNRQRFANEKTIGQSKVAVAKKELLKISGNSNIIIYQTMLNENNAISILNDHDLVIDCLDNIKSRFILNSSLKKLKIPYVHGAIGGFWGQVSIIFPDDNTLEKIYNVNSFSNEKTLGNPSFVPTTIASLEASEAIKFLTNKGDLLRNKLLFVDLMYNDFQIIELA